VYNVRDYETNYNLGGIPSFLAASSTKEMLHVPENVMWSECNNDIYNAMTQDIMNTAINYFPLIIDNIRTMIYVGQDDLICNTLTVQAMVAQINSPIMGDFPYYPKLLWSVNGIVAGYAQTYNNFVLVNVMKSGHMVPHDQPIVARDLVYRFVINEQWA